MPVMYLAFMISLVLAWKKSFEQTEWPVKYDAETLMWRHPNKIIDRQIFRDIII